MRLIYDIYYLVSLELFYSGLALGLVDVKWRSLQPSISSLFFVTDEYVLKKINNLVVHSTKSTTMFYYY